MTPIVEGILSILYALMVIVMGFLALLLVFSIALGLHEAMKGWLRKWRAKK